MLHKGVALQVVRIQPRLLGIHTREPVPRDWSMGPLHCAVWAVCPAAACHRPKL